MQIFYKEKPMADETPDVGQLNLEQLSNLIAAAQAQAEKLKEAELQELRDACEAIAAGAGMSVAQLFGFRARRKSGGKKAGAKATPKYRDPATGEEWSGRGRPPKWMAAHEEGGGKREDLAI
jgi:DNA-binding protein H-NS